MGKALFITGTGTDVGKTFVTGLIVKRLRDAGKNGGYYKAALSGAERAADGTLLPGDALHVNRVAAIGETVENLVSYIYEEAVSPHLAAQHTGRPIDFAKVQADYQRAKAKFDYLTMEGSGGIICPLRWDEAEHLVLDDVVERLGLPALIVADAGLGTINATVLTIEHLNHRLIPVKGVILNSWTGGAMEEDNRKMIEAMTGVPVVALVRRGDAELAMDAEALAALYA